MPGEIDELAGALADGERIDWEAARARLTSPDSRTVADGLESISRLSVVAPPPARPSRRLPWLLEGARVLAAVRTLAGIGGFALALDARSALLAGVAATFGAVALFLDIGGRDRRARALAACFWTTAAAFAARGVTQLFEAWPALGPIAFVVALQPEAFFGAAVWQFARDFPRVTRFSQLDEVCRWGVQVSMAIGVLCVASGLVALVAPGTRVSELLHPFRREKAFDYTFWLLVFGAAFSGLVVMVWRSRGAEGKERARVRLFLGAVILAFGPIVSQVIVLALVPSYLRLVQSSPRVFFWLSVAVYAPMFALPGATAYAVAARDVLDVRVVIQRGLRYVLARWLLLWGAVVPLGLLLGHLYRHSDLTLRVALATGPAPTLLWFAGVGVMVLALRGRLTRALDEWALPGIEEPSAALAAMTERMRTTRTPLEVTIALAEAIERATQAPARAYLFVEGALVPAAGGDATLPVESAIPALLEGASEPAIVSSSQHGSYYSLLLETDRAWIDRLHVEVVVPVMAGRSGTGLLGLVTLSIRRNALRFSTDDLRFVRAAAANASLACDAVASEGLRTNAAGDGLDELAVQCLRCGHVAERSKDAGHCTCGGGWEPASLPKCVHGRFDLRDWIGAGGMGVVYRALDLDLGRDVALKTLPLLSDDGADRLMAEARAMASLSHEDVAVLYEVERWRGTPLIVMEFLPGGTLAARLRDARLPEADLIALVRVLARTLGRVHARGLYHGDIKPSNVGFASDGRPKLLDFGLSRALARGDVSSDRRNGTPATRLGGTWAYLAPEVREGAAPGPALDLWALGVVLCEGLLGEHPFPRARTRDELVTGRAAALHRARVSRSHAHHDALARLLALDPAERPRTATEFDGLLASL